MLRLVQSPKEAAVLRLVQSPEEAAVLRPIQSPEEAAVAKWRAWLERCPRARVTTNGRWSASLKHSNTERMPWLTSQKFRKIHKRQRRERSEEALRMKQQQQQPAPKSEDEVSNNQHARPHTAV